MSLLPYRNTVWRPQPAALADLAASAIVVVDENNKVIHAELAEEIRAGPNYDAAIAALS